MGLPDSAQESRRYLDAGGSLVGYLEHLSELHGRGVLNEEGFAAAKHKLLADVEKPLG